MVIDPLLLILAFLTAFIAIIFGMGFGLTMTPILLFLDYTPKDIADETAEQQRRAPDRQEHGCTCRYGTAVSRNCGPVRS